MTLLELRAVEAGYGASQVLFGIDLAIREGEVATLLGRNGMGKTTTVRALFGLIPLQGGEIRFAGERLDGRATDAIARSGIALVPEGRQIFPNLTVRENLEAFAANRSGAAQPWNVERVRALFPRLAERWDAMGHQLSGGEQQMLAIGRALMARPRLLLLDEPSLGLAPVVLDEVFHAITAVAATGVGVLLVEQDVERALSTCSRGYLLIEGRITATGTTGDLRENADVRQRVLGI